MEKAGNKILEKNKLNQPKRRLFDDFKRVILAIRVALQGFYRSISAISRQKIRFVLFFSSIGERAKNTLKNFFKKVTKIGKF